MSDRISGLITLVLTAVYGYIAYTVIKAPFQYDPLGPETWPRILAVVAALCCFAIVLFPDDYRFQVAGSTLSRLAVVVVLLSGYAYLFEHAGFIVATALFCSMLAKILGATTKEALLFGPTTGVAGYLLCGKLLDLNLPAGILSFVS